MDSFIELCQRRRSIRKYTNQPVEQEKTDYLLRCALMSPSSKRTNPWEFVVVRDEAKLRPMASCRTYGSQMFATAMAAIVVAVDPSLSDTWMADGAIAAEHILLAAAEQGLILVQSAYSLPLAFDGNICYRLLRSCARRSQWQPQQPPAPPNLENHHISDQWALSELCPVAP